MTTRRWWICRCGRRLYEHSHRRVSNAGTFEYPCAFTESGRFESETMPELVYDEDRGLRAVTP